MSDSSWADELDAAIAAVHATAVIARDAFFAGSTGVEDKPDATPVSDADVVAEKKMRAELCKRFPDDSVVGEEMSPGDELPTGRVWLLDPIDGTSNAVTGVNPLFMSTACLVADGKPVVAALESPITGQLFTATKGGGAYLTSHGRRTQLSVSEVTDLAKARVLVGIGSSQEDADWLARVYPKLLELENLSSPRHFGSSAYDLCLAAAGGLSPRGVDAKIDHGSQSWDLAPGVLLVREAGGEALDADGRSWLPSVECLIVASQGLVQALVDLSQAARIRDGELR